MQVVQSMLSPSYVISKCEYIEISVPFVSVCKCSVPHSWAAKCKASGFRHILNVQTGVQLRKKKTD